MDWNEWNKIKDNTGYHCIDMIMDDICELSCCYYKIYKYEHYHQNICLDDIMKHKLKCLLINLFNNQGLRSEDNIIGLGILQEPMTEHYVLYPNETCFRYDDLFEMKDLIRRHVEWGTTNEDEVIIRIDEKDWWNEYKTIKHSDIVSFLDCFYY